MVNKVIYAGPHNSFPIRTQKDVYDAAKLVGHAKDPEAVKRKIVQIAKEKNLKLPKKWIEEKSEMQIAVVIP